MLTRLYLLVFLPSISAFGKTISIGGLFDTEDVGKAFELSVNHLNQDRHGDDELPRQFIRAEYKLVGNDSYDMTESVCELGDAGVAAIFGPQNKVTSSYAQSMCDKFEIPYITATWNPKRPRDTGLANMYPDAAKLSHVYYQLVKDYAWKSFTIIYENTDSLIRVNQLLKRWDPNGHTVTLRQLSEGPNHRAVLRQVKDSSDRKIILDCSLTILPDVLEQAQQVGIIDDRYHYLITCLDLQTINLEPFQYSGANITGFRMIDVDDFEVVEMFERDRSSWSVDDLSQLRLEVALIYDSVRLFGRALRQLDNPNNPDNTDVRPWLCRDDDSWIHGSAILNYMKSTEIKGLTGPVRLYPGGYRTDFKLDVVGLGDQGLQKIGIWNSSSSSIEYFPRQLTSEERELDLHNRTFIVLISLTPPYGMLKNSSEPMVGNDRYEGFGIDVIKKLSDLLGFNYTFEEEAEYGSKHEVTGEWNGMIQKIIEGKADLAITDLTITYEREEAADFTMPFMSLGISILYKKPKKAGSSPFSFLAPFSKDVWYYLFGAYIFVSILLWILGRMSKAEWNNPYPCIEEPSELENQFNLKNSLWFTIGSIMQQGSEIAPIGLSTRMVAGSWWFFCLIIVSSYTANLAAFLLAESPEVKIRSVTDLAAQTEIKYGAKRQGSTINFFRDSSDPTYKKMYKYMQENWEDVMPLSNAKAVTKVKEENYAFLSESSSIEYTIQRECNLSQVGGLLDAKGYGIAMKKNSQFRTKMSSAVLQLQETGVLTELKKLWWEEKRIKEKCTDDGASGDARPLGTDNVGGIFLVLITGVFVSCFYTAWELIWEVGCTSINEDVSFKEEMMEELKFLVKCNAESKPVRKRKGSSSVRSNEDVESTRDCSPPYGFVPTVITTSHDDE